MLSRLVFLMGQTCLHRIQETLTTLFRDQLEGGCWENWGKLVVLIYIQAAISKGEQSQMGQRYLTTRTKDQTMLADSIT